MFQTLADQEVHASGKERMFRYSAVAIIAIVLFVLLYFGVKSAG